VPNGELQTGVRVGLRLRVGDNAVVQSVVEAPRGVTHHVGLGEAVDGQLPIRFGACRYDKSRPIKRLVYRRRRGSVYRRRRGRLLGWRGRVPRRWLGFLVGLGLLLVAGLCMGRRSDEQHATGGKDRPRISHDSRSFEVVPTAPTTTPD